MIIPPSPLGENRLSRDTLSKDLASCQRIGSCGFGKEAVYLGSFYFSRRYYLRWSEVHRIFKRIALSAGGFSGKGIFGAIPYIVVSYGQGKEKKVAFKTEAEADQILQWVRANRPAIPIHSEEAERRLAEAEAAEEARYKQDLSPEAEKTLANLRRSKSHLESKPLVYGGLCTAAKQKRIVDNLKPSILAVSAVVAVLGAAAAVYGLAGLLLHQTGAGYFLAGGGAAFFTVLSAGTMPGRWTSRKNALKEWNSAVERSRKNNDGKGIPVPPQYAHPIVLERMIRVVREGRAQTAKEALEVVKSDLKSLNSTVKVSQKEHDEVAEIKPLFLVCDYKDEYDDGNV